jgi:hypothetical protein
VERSINLRIDYQCPQCGAPAEISETDRLFRCAFCKVSSYLVERKYFRYVLPHNAPESRELIWFPYWRFKGMIFFCLPSGIKNRFLDASRQAVSDPLFPVSVGLRSQAMKLQFVTPDLQGRFVKPALPFGRVLDGFLERINRDMPEPILHQAHVGESLSLIYAPFYAGNKIMDAVLNQPVSRKLDEDYDPDRLDGGPPGWRIRFLATLCPACGWDMQGSRDALALHCKNCETMWQAGKEGMTKLNVACMKAAENENTVYLPFWRIRANISGIELRSYADVIRVANLPRVAQPGWEQIPFYFWGPAFKVRPQSFLRLTQQMTLSQPRKGLTGEVPKGKLHPVNLPVSESVETLKLSLAGFMRPEKPALERLDDIQIQANRYLLVYIPFEVRHHDLVQPDFNFAVNRSQLALAGNL